MPPSKFPETALQEIQKCAQCGKCRSACPVFAVVKDEAFVARGRVALADALAKGAIPVSAQLRSIMSACLMCRRCSEVCPSGVDFMEVLLAARARVAEEKGLPFGASFFFRHVLPRRPVFDAVIRLAALAQKLIPGKKSGTLRHLPLLFKRGKFLPPLSPASALKLYAGTPGPKSASPRVGIFIGCLMNYVYPHVIGAAIQLLRNAGIEVIVPASQLCCGTPVLALGDIEAARMLARTNQAAFDALQCDYIVTLCASCGRTLKDEYRRLLGSETAPFQAPVLDVAEFLDEYVTLDLRPLDRPVSYHDPCHLRWGQGVAAEPRRLLSRAAQFIEAPGEMTCCGQAGTFHVFFPEFAEEIGQKKMESLAATDAAEIATGCPGCMLELNHLLARSGSNRKAVHTIEILARSMESVPKA